MDKLRAALQLAILVAILSSSLLFGGDGLITTIAGFGHGGSLASGIPATAAQITPGGIWVDASDNLFIADSGNNRVVRVDAVSGMLTLVAGNGTAASGGDGGLATLASLNDPQAVTLDAAGNMYIAETGGDRIRVVNAQTGVISTFAGTGAYGFGGDGGPATSAMLSQPWGLAFDLAGDLYFADFGNNRVRRIDAQTGIITTVAGNGSWAFTADGALAASASLSYPIWIAFDHSGRLLIGEMGIERIRRVDPLTGILTTVAGIFDGETITGPFTGDGVPATSAGIGIQGQLVVDPNDNIFFADGTGRVRRVDATTGLIITVAGNGTGEGGPWVASAGGSATLSCNSTAAGDGGPATSAVLNAPFGVQLTSAGNLLVSDAYDCRVRRVDLPSPNAYTNTTIAANLTVAQPGQEVLLTATVLPIGVSGVPTGSVEFLAQTAATTPVLLGTAVLSSGIAQLPISIGTNYNIMAVYSGDGSFNGSGSPRLPGLNWIGTKIVATVSLSASQNPSPAGAPVVFTATVTPPAGTTTAPTGPVLLYDGSTLVTIVNLVNGVATLPDTFTALGIHAMTARYLGDNNYSQVSSAVLTHTVGKAPVVMTMTASANPATAYQPITLTATVSPVTATGTVQFVQYNPPGVALWGTVTLTNGTATLTVPSLAPGTYNLGANYSGDANFQSLSWGMSLVVKPAPPSSVTLTSSLNPAARGQTVTFTAVVSPSTATGTMTFLDGSTSLGTVTISGATAALSVSTLSIGAHPITAAYSGDANDAPGTSTSLLEYINKTVSSVGLT